MKYGCLFLFISLNLFFSGNCYSQNETLDAVYIDIVTNNKVLIDFSRKLENFEIGNPAIMNKGFELFKNLPEKDKDSALLIFIYIKEGLIILTEPIKITGNLQENTPQMKVL